MSLSWLVVMNLLARDASKLTTTIDSCDNYGTADVASCKAEIDASPVQAALATVVAKQTAERSTYCVDYAKPITGKAAQAPVVGFRCWQQTELSTTEVELTCRGEFCTVTREDSNDDEDQHYAYSFRITGRGKALAVDGGVIHVTYRSNN